MVPPIVPATSWPSTHSNPKWVFPRLNLVISPPKPAGEKEDDNVSTMEKWAPPEPSTHPTSRWGSNDKGSPPSVGTPLVA